MKTAPTQGQKPIGHPYARISDPDQRKGGGLIRQTTCADALREFCERFGLTLGKRVWIDDGVSAFKGLNASPEHQLGQFLSEARRGLIHPGHCLIIENYDRLSRQDPWAAIGLVNDLRQLGIHVGRLDRMKLLRCDSTDYGDFFEAAIEFMRGNSESTMKSARNRDRWEKKRTAARTKKEVMTHRLPAWVEERNGELHLIPSAANAVKRIFDLAAAGYGQQVLVKQLIKEGVRPIGTAEVWARSYVGKLLRDRRVLGELQPRLSNREPHGDVIVGYYPAAVTEEEFNAARAGAAARKMKRGRVGNHVNVFAGLLYSARDGESYFVTSSLGAMDRGGRGTGQRVLKNTASLQGRERCYTFPLATFERAVFSFLREIDPRSVLNGNTGPDECLVLAGEIARVEERLAGITAELIAEGTSPTLTKARQALESQQRELAARLAEARQKAAHPLSEAWGEAQGILATVESAPDTADARLRLRSVLRQMIDSIWLLVVPRGQDRLAVVQVWFKEQGKEKSKRHRDYIILHRPPKANGSFRADGGWWVKSFADVESFGEMNLRQPEHVQRLARALEAIDVSSIAN